MGTALAGQRDARRDRWQIAVIAAVAALLFTTVTLAGPCRTQPQSSSILKAVTTKVATTKAATTKAATAKAAVVKPVAAIAQAVAQAASAPRKPARVRATMAQALLRLPTTPMAFAVLCLLTCIAAIPVYKRAAAATDSSRLLPRADYRALLQVFLI
jgi:hypothetical protein